MSEQVCTQSISSPADSPVSHFPWLESKKAKGTNVTYGRKCSELSTKLRRVGWWVKTFLESCELPLPTLSRTWSVKAITSSCLILKLRLSERRTEGSASRLWPTVVARDYKDGTALACRNVSAKGHLGRVIHIPNTGLWKTPIAADAANKQFYVNSRGEPNLSAQVKCSKIETREEHGNGSLNPAWVEWLMGYPIGWTEV